jgi:hypothetical protein
VLRVLTSTWFAFRDVSARVCVTVPYPQHQTLPLRSVWLRSGLNIEFSEHGRSDEGLIMYVSATSGWSFSTFGLYRENGSSPVDKGLTAQVLN